MILALKKIAEKSPHGKSQHAAVLIKSGRVMASAYNRGKGHAEERVIGKVSRDTAKGSVIWVIRLMSDDSLGMSHPCDQCIVLLASYEVKQVYYSTETGDIEGFKPEKIRLFKEG